MFHNYRFGSGVVIRMCDQGTNHTNIINHESNNYNKVPRGSNIFFLCPLDMFCCTMLLLICSIMICM